MLDLFAKKESPMQGMMGLGGGVPSRLLTLASGKITYVDDVFSTDLWSGNGTARNINTGLDMSGEGGMVWLKRRNGATNPMIYDTERGTYHLETDGTAAQSQFSNFLTGYRDDGYSIGTSLNINGSGTDAVGWSFRKCPGFFDIVTWTGNSTAGRQIAHSLGSTPGMIIVKCTNHTYSWNVYHRSLTGTHYLELETQGSAGPNANIWNNTNPTSTHFTVGNSVTVNETGKTYIAYIFAHNDGSFGEDSDEAVIKCDSYTGTQSENTEINVGFEPQWIFIKNASSNSTDWVVVDMMRGLPVGSDSEVLKANSNSTPASYRAAALTPTGFKLGQAVASVNGSGDTYIYVAIRRPHKPPEAGTDVFAANLLSASNNGIQNVWTPGFVPDALFVKKHETADDMRVAARISGKRGFLVTNGNNAEPGGSTDYYHFDDTTNTIHQTYIGGGSDSTINYAFKRTPGFFDVVAYSGSNSAQNISHNLGSKPALIICKRRNSTGNWQVYADVPAGGATKYLMLDDTSTFDTNTNSNRWNNTEPTATQFTVGTYSDLNTSGGTYLAYLFGNLDGICKIGEYAGTGNDITIDCGFNPRFIMIKVSTNSGNGWYVVDYVRGINAGNDPWLRFNQSNAQITSTDIVDPTSGGFIVQAGGGGRVNDADGRKYLYMAIA